MIKFESNTLWNDITRLSQRASHRAAAVAYVSDDRDVQFGMGDVLVVDASDAAIAGRRTDREVLARALERGAEVYHVEDLHAKAMVFDDTVVVGSSNISRNAAEELVEAAIITTFPEIRERTLGEIRALSGIGIRLDRGFIARIRKIRLEQVRKRVGGRTASKPDLMDAIAEGNPLLDDYVFVLFDPSTGKSNEEALQLADRHETRLPERWEYLEWYRSRSTRQAIRSKLETRARKVIFFEVESKDGRVIRAKRLLPDEHVFLEVLDDKQTYTVYFARGGRPPFNVRGQAGGDFCSAFTNAVRTKRQLAKRLYDDPIGILSAGRLRRLLGLG